MIGASFVITQYHASVMFAPNVVGTANARSAGWGNLGGGVTQIVMPLGLAAFLGMGLTDFCSWRLAMVSIDWLISTEPHWHSTVYAVYNFSGLFTSALAAASHAGSAYVPSIQYEANERRALDCRTMLKFNKSTVIGLYAMLELAREPGETLPAAEIADRFHASRHHLVKVLQQLARAGLVESERGASGGHRLAGRPQDVTLAQIVEVFEGPHQEDSLCLLMDPDARADNASYCSLHPVFQQLSSMIVLKLQSISLQTILAHGSGRQS